LRNIKDGTALLIGGDGIQLPLPRRYSAHNVLTFNDMFLAKAGGDHIAYGYVAVLWVKIQLAVSCI
jgi:hypothetical protein